MEKVKIFNAGLLDVLFLRLEASPAAWKPVIEA
jgi:hypothetical protein